MQDVEPVCDLKKRSSLRHSVASCPVNTPSQLHAWSAAQYNNTAGYDPLLELPDGQKRKPAVGYERPLIGATTNFVGNHMTQVQRAALTLAHQACEQAKDK